MTAFFIRRALWMIPVLLLVALVTFFLMHQAPGGPWDREKPVNPSTLASLNAKFGLDKPLWFNPAAATALQAQGERNPLTLVRALFDTQFWGYLGGAAHGDLGPSYASRGTESVQSVIAQKFPASAKTGLVAVLFALIVGVPLGVMSALKQNSLADYAGLFVATIGISVPNFIIGVLLIILLSATIGLPPIRRPEEWQGLSAAYVLPGIVLGLGTMAFIARLTRSAMLEVKRQDFTRTARAKGLSDQMLITRHMLRNSLIPVITILGPAIADLITGSFVIETIFNVPGMGREFVSSISTRDYSMIMGTTLFYALLVVLANLSVDLSYGLIDPRIRARQ